MYDPEKIHVETNVLEEEKDQAFHHRFRSLHFRSRAFLVIHPPFLSFIPGQRNGGISHFLASLAGAQDENKGTRRNGEKEE